MATYEDLKGFYQQSLKDIEGAYSGQERKAARNVLGEWYSSQLQSLSRAESAARRQKSQEFWDRQAQQKAAVEAERAQWARDKATLNSLGRNQEFGKLISEMDRARSTGMPMAGLEQKYERFFGRGDSDSSAASYSAPSASEYNLAQDKQDLASKQTNAIKAATKKTVVAKPAAVSTAAGPIKSQAAAAPTQVSAAPTQKAAPVQQVAAAPAQQTTTTPIAQAAPAQQTISPSANTTTPARTASTFRSQLFGSARTPNTTQAANATQNVMGRYGNRPRVTQPVQQAAKPAGMKKGGQVKVSKPKVIKVTASKRGDGIAQRGKTKGRIV